MLSQISIALSLSGICRVGLGLPRMSLRRKGFSELPACGVILRRDPRVGQRVEKRGFADVGQPNDAALQCHGIPLWINPLRTIEPNTGVVEVPEPRCAPQALISRVCGSGFEGFCHRFA